VLNVGLLAPGAGSYYIDSVASSAEDYYTGRGESAGRWVGDLARSMGLVGEVSPEDFRAVLAGRDPQSGELLVNRGVTRSKALDGLDPAREVDAEQAAALLGVSARHVRRLLDAGERITGQQGAAVDHDSAPATSTAHLIGRRVQVGGQQGPEEWRVAVGELQRFVESRSERKYRPGYDLTLRPPKSVSVLWSLAGPEVAKEVREAHADAVDQVVRYVERHVIRGRSQKSSRRVPTDGVIAAAFDHRTSRAGDPLLHTHVVVANMTRYAVGDETLWRTIESTAIFEHAKAAGCLYQAHLRSELTSRLGVAWSPVVNGYSEIDGVPAGVIDLFSKRRKEIEEELAASGHSSTRAAQVATLQTRKAKDYSVDTDTLTARWTAEAASVGFAAEDARSCLARVTPEGSEQLDVAELFARLAGPRGVTERSARFRRADVVEAIAVTAASGLTADRVNELADSFLAAPDVVAVVELDARSWRGSGQAVYTTVELAQMESAITRLAARRGARLLPHAATVEAAVALRPELSDEQASMVTRVCQRDQTMLAVEGRPGAGKTYATEAIVGAHVDAGIPILGCAVSAAAAAELESQAGFARSGVEATTLAKLLWDLDRWGGLAAGAVVIVDEASMISTRDLHRLATHVDTAGGRIVLIGDPDQHGSVEAGGMFAALCKRDGDDLIQLVENRRQEDHVDRLAIADYRDGLIADAVGRLDDARRIVRSATAGESFDAMVADWYAARIAGGADPMIAGPNSTRRALNERARVLLKAAGELTGEALVVSGREFLVGDEVVARRNDRTLRVPGVSDFVKNGSAGHVLEVHEDECEVTVRFEREGDIRIPATYLAAGHLEHGYARTTYGVQGHTHQTARYHPTDASNFEEGYVALTRGRSGSRLYVVDGTLDLDDDLTHGAQRIDHDLDDITVAFAQRRANTPAGGPKLDLGAVAELTGRMSLAEIREERGRLGRLIAAAPADTTEVIESASTARAALQVRARTVSLVGERPDGLERRIDTLTRRIEAARRQQDARAGWMNENAEVVERHRLLATAERSIETRMRDNPVAYLPEPWRALLGSAPEQQADHSRWTAAATALVLHIHRYGDHRTPAVRDSRDAGWPGPPDSATSWDRVVEALRDAGVGPDADRWVGSGVEL